MLKPQLLPCPQDYPSLALLGEKLAENNINLIFAVTKGHYMLYKVHLEGVREAGGLNLGAVLTRR